MIRKKMGKLGDWGKRRGLMMKRPVRDKEKHIYIE
jgi:hypothetical protein